MPLKLSSPYYLLITTDIQQIKNSLTAILTKLTSDDPTENTGTEIKPIPQGQCSDRRRGSTQLPILFASLHRSGFEIFETKFDVLASPEEFMKTITHMIVLN